MKNSLITEKPLKQNFDIRGRTARGQKRPLQGGTTCCGHRNTFHNFRHEVGAAKRLVSSSGTDLSISEVGAHRR